MTQKTPKKGRTGEKEGIPASPTKLFFVRMLTRDIDLRDAILDLLDNCVDGIRRTLAHSRTTGTKPYKKFHANIIATPERFVIEDNCGGIPLKDARESAFRLGRPATAEREQLQTVGVYGIGMKRAIFKLGQNAVVVSEHNGERFRVEINSDWLQDDAEWTLELIHEKPTGDNGTRIEVTDLYPEIKREFATSQTGFLANLNESINQLFTFIMDKGFSVTLNSTELAPLPFNLLVTPEDIKADPAINPYVFKGQFGKVDVQIIVGFYRKPMTDEELDLENESPKADLSQAGWSIICNDRLVVRSDKSALTGWGTVKVPRFHNQFSSIAGIVNLQSNDPLLLPLNTTKRGIETSSDVYFRLLDYMREGVKKFTDYTNQWKSHRLETKAQFDRTVAKSITEIPAVISADRFTTVSKMRLASPNSSAQVFDPPLPKPKKDNGELRKIVFSRPLKDIQLLAEELLGDADTMPSQVGEACFDAQLVKFKPSRKR